MSSTQFELGRTKVAQSGVQALPIVPNLDVLKDGCSGQRMGCKLLRHTFGLESTKETFCDRIVVAVTNPAHAHLNVFTGQTGLVDSTGILAALVGMM